MALSMAAAALGSAALSTAGGLWSNAQNIANSKDQMDFQKDMYQHRYQYTMDDMRKAGLNPIFAYKGIGVGSPSGAMANVSNPLSGIESAVNSAKGISKAEQEMRVLRAQEQQLQDSAGLSNSQDALNRQQHRITEEILPALVKEARANASSAQSAAEANEFTKALMQRDARFELEHPGFMWWRKISETGGNSAHKMLELMRPTTRIPFRR